MGRPKIDMVGHQFGELVVLSEAKPPKPDAHAYWLCRCSCGNTKIISGQELRSGKHVTCAACNRYHEEIGFVCCTVRNGGQFIFDKDDLSTVQMHVWYIDKHGYVSTNNPCTVSLHRMLMNPQADEEIDHINGNPSDNRRANLRYATRQQNARNTQLRTDNSSGYKGVGWHKQSKRYRASISVNGKHISLGFFNTPIEAAVAYNAAAVFYFGEFAKLNSINEEETIRNGKEPILAMGA